jgi:hypothetical protein
MKEVIAELKPNGFNGNVKKSVGWKKCQLVTKFLLFWPRSLLNFQCFKLTQFNQNNHSTFKASYVFTFSLSAYPLPLPSLSYIV